MAKRDGAAPRGRSRAVGRGSRAGETGNDADGVIAAREKHDALALPPRRSLPDMVAERLMEAMRSGELKPGDRLIETTLARRLGVSRAPLREAMKTLAAGGLIETAQGRGATVRAVADGDMVRMVAVRATLEGLAARLVAGEAPDPALAELARLHDEIEAVAASGDMVRLRQLDWSFHERVCLVSGNPFLLESWRSISNLVRINLGRRVGYLGTPAGVLDSHRLFISALQARDPDRAEAVFRARLILTGYAALDLPVPPHLRSWLGDEAMPPARRVK